MIQFASFLWVMVVLFAIIGFVRGSLKEIIAMAGIVLGIFILEQLRDVLVSPLVASAELDQQFYLYAGILLAAALFAYETPERIERIARRSGSGRDNLQESLLGALLGGFNAYMLFGALWYYLDNLSYPLWPNVIAPPAGSGSALMVNQLPLVWLIEGNLLTLMIILLFLFVMIVLV